MTLLTLEQVKKADRFAWDEYMNLYLPQIGFVAPLPVGTRPRRTKAVGPQGPKPNFVPRLESMLRPIGWHHLDGCSCEFCEPPEGDRAEPAPPD